MPGFGRWFGFGLLRIFDDPPEPSYDHVRNPIGVPFRCPRCSHIAWSKLIDIQCGGMPTDRHPPTWMKKVPREGVNKDEPHATKGLITGINLADE